MDIKSPEGRFRARKEIQALMLGQLMRALHAYQNLDDNQTEQVKITIDKWQNIVARIRARAQELGYSQACQNHISTCKGQCCKWHFPKKLYDVHVFISVNGLSSEESKSLVDLLSDITNEAYQCPMLMENGCFLSFENRPILCSSAYPCFTGQVYQDFLEQEKTELKGLYEDMENMIKTVCENAP